VATLLLEAEAGSRFQLPALHVAAKKDDVHSILLLLKNKHDPNGITKVDYWSGLRVASCLPRPANAETNLAAYTLAVAYGVKVGAVVYLHGWLHSALR